MFLNLANTLVKKLLAEVNKSCLRYVEIYKNILNLRQNKFKFLKIE